MTTQKKLRSLTLAIAMSFAAWAAYAETVTVSTYYPSPYGSYRNLTTTDQTNLATTAGNVVIGGAGAGAAKLDVTGNARVSGNATIVGNAIVSGNLNLASGGQTGNLVLASCNTGTNVCYAQAVYS